LLNRDTDAVVKASTFANVSGKGFQMKLSRRNLLKAALGMPAAAWLLNYRAAAVLDMIHPDVAYSGGITGCRKIADYAALTRTPMGMPSGPCSLIRFYASMHMGAATQNFFKVENALGAFRGNKEKMAQGPEPAVRKSMFPVPEGPGLGLDLNEDWLRAHVASGDAWWG
jgi:L-alanine-DL-glutamate epimerase-like enolase superfamily enzyme